MNYTVHYFTLDTEKSDAQAFLSVRQGETNRRLGIKLVTDGKPYEYSDDIFACVAGVYPDGTRFMNPAAIENNTVEYALSANNTANVGEVECEVRLYGTDDTLLVSPAFKIHVYSSTGITEDDFDEDDVDALTQLISDAQEAIGDCEEATQGALEAKEAAEDAAEAANSAADAANEAAGAAEEAAEKASHLPYIDSVTHHWFVWNALTEAYVDTGISAEGEDGDDGYSPVVTITEITGGHRVTITDETHQQGQSFDVLDGAHDAGDISYSKTGTYDNGTAGKELQRLDDEKAEIDDESAGSDKTWSAEKIAEEIEAGGKVKTVNGVDPDEDGNVEIGAGDIEYASETTYEDGSVGKELTSQSSRIATLDANVKSTAQAKAEYHLGFYRDADGDLCEA